MLLATILGAGCAAPPPSSTDNGTEIARREAHTWDLLYIAIIEIQVRCPDFGAYLYGMYQSYNLHWGALPSGYTYGYATYGTVSEPGYITMDQSKYDKLEMLIADLFHEAGHAVGEQPDVGEPYTDSFGRPDMNRNPWDDFYDYASCPTVFN